MTRCWAGTRSGSRLPNLELCVRVYPSNYLRRKLPQITPQINHLIRFGRRMTWIRPQCLNRVPQARKCGIREG